CSGRRGPPSASKGLEYPTGPHNPGPNQLRLYRLSGQRKVPVIEHDGTVIADSTEIALYLERVFPDRRRLLPEAPEPRHEVLALEDQLDSTLGANLPLVWIRYAVDDERLLDVLGAAKIPFGRGGLRVMATLVKGVSDRIGPFRRRLDEAEQIVRRTLEDLCRRLESSKYLVGDEPSLAD